MKMGDNPAMKIMPIKADKDSKGLYDLRETCAEMKSAGRGDRGRAGGELQGPALQRRRDGDSWVSPDVPGWHMVKMVTKEEQTMVLTAMGSGAKNEITEKPMDMKAMMSNPEAMKKMMESQKGESNK